ncbi:MAG TPA: NUDIX domain-containing protein [Stellaceae bacterium]|nr:NUDIX domain-containing protein [Stellaceae bacterium]
MTNDAAPIEPRPAATVLLLRDGNDGLEVLMVTRNVAADFASGALVFPGGRVEPADAEAATLARCRIPAGVGERAMGFRAAAVRETFEEAHLLLARPAGEERLLAAPELNAIEAGIERRLGRRAQLDDLMATGEIELATDLLVPFAHWITPVGPPKRFDTHFFLAPAPVDQIAAHDGHEAVETLWIAPQRAIAESEARRVTLVFATRMNLMKLGRSRTVAEALAAARADTIVTVCPEVVEGPEGKTLRIPAAAGYGITEMPAHLTARAWVPRGTGAS